MQEAKGKKPTAHRRTNKLVSNLVARRHVAGYEILGLFGLGALGVLYQIDHAAVHVFGFAVY